MQLLLLDSSRFLIALIYWKRKWGAWNKQGHLTCLDSSEKGFTNRFEFEAHEILPNSPVQLLSGRENVHGKCTCKKKRLY